jgi:hypothetical protein
LLAVLLATAAYADESPLTSPPPSTNPSTTTGDQPPPSFDQAAPESVPPLPPWPDRTSPFRYQGDDGVDMSLLSNDQLSITLMEQTPSGWRSVCSSPCKTRVDPKDSFGIGGYGINPSPEFQLKGPSTIRVSPAEPSSYWLLYTGGFLMVHGGIFFAVGSGIGNSGPGPTFRTFGAVEAIVGVPLIIYELWTIFHLTSVDITPGVY